MWLDFVTSPSGPTSPSYFVAACVVLPVVCIFPVALRFNARILQKAGLKRDDWIMIPALVMVIGMAICGLIGYKNGVWAYLTPADASDSSTAFEGKLLEAFQYIQIIALALIKLGALAFYHRIFGIKSHRTIFDMTRTITVIIILLWTIAMLAMNSLQCGSHISALWTGYDVWTTYCSAMSPAYEEAFGISNFLLDLWVLFLPMPKIFGLHTTTRRKFAIAGVFLLAAVGLATCTARMAVYIETSNNALDTNVDYRLTDTLEVYWSILEAGTSLLAVNLPSLWFYSTKLSPESVLASIRSAISLRSLRSNSSHGSRSRNARTVPRDGLSTHSASSQAKIVSAQSHEIYTMHDVEAQHEPLPPHGAIMVNSTIQQEEMKG